MEVQALSPEVIQDTSTAEVEAIASSDIQSIFGSNYIGTTDYIYFPEGTNTFPQRSTAHLVEISRSHAQPY